MTAKTSKAPKTQITKRKFLMGAGVAAVGAATSGGAIAQDKTNWDVIVVGGGNAGLPTAIFAAQRGAKVLVIEAAGQVGGTLFLSSGQMSAAGTKLQKSKGIEDKPQYHYDDIMRISKHTADPVIVKLATENAAPVFDWLMDNGFTPRPEHPLTGTTHEPYSRARYAWGAEGGRSILKVLNAQLAPQVAAGRVKVLTQTEVTELVQKKDGTVTGVVAKDKDGKVVRYNSHYVALTCGGYTFNPAMFQQIEGAKTYTQATYPFSMGAGITLGVKAGGYVRGGEYHTPIFGAVLASDELPSPMRAMARHFPPERAPWEIFVNVRGQRFLREDIPSHDAYEQALRVQPEERCWVVFDDEIYKNAPVLVRGGFAGPWTPEDTAEAFKSGTEMFYKADTIADLAKKAGLDAKNLSDTVADYNRGQASGKDALGREHMPRPIVKAPFYAVQLQSWNLTSYGGLAVDGELRVVRMDGKPVPNLYAAGELIGTGATMGQSLCGGMAVTPALAFGRLLGNQILKFG